MPLVVRWPGKVAQGQQSDQLICLTDLMASFADLLAFPLPHDAAPDSFNVMPALLDYRVRCDRPGMVNDTTRGDMSLRQASWKFAQLAAETRHKGTRQMLFDLENDPAEQHDLIDTLPEKAAVMRAALNRLMTEASSRRSLERRPVESEEPFKCESQ